MATAAIVAHEESAMKLDAESLERKLSPTLHEPLIRGGKNAEARGGGREKPKGPELVLAHDLNRLRVFGLLE